MRTQVFGEYDTVMDAITAEIKEDFALKNTVVFVMKVVNADLGISQ